MTQEVLHCMEKRSLKIPFTSIMSAFLIAACFFAISLGIYLTFILVPLFFIIMLDRESNAIELLYGNVLGIVLMLLVSFKVISYALFPQAAVLYYTNPDVFFWFSRGNAHAVRLLVAYPGILLSNWFVIDITGGITLYSAALFLLIMNFMLRILKYNEMENWISSVLGSFVILVLSFIMNGRMIFCFFGITLLMMCEVMYNRDRISILTLQIFTYVAIFFATVSSGVLTIITVYAVLITPYRWHLTKQIKEKIYFVFLNIISLFIAVTFFLSYLIRMIMRNVIFFGGGFRGVFNMLKHGFGKVLYTENTLFTILLIALGALVVITNVYLFEKNIVKKQNKDLPLILMVNLSAYGLLFGRSTGLSMLIPLVIILLEILNKNVSVKIGNRGR